MSEETKEIRMMVQIRNNRMLEAREKTGMSQSKAAQAIGISKNVLRGYESMQRKPVDGCGGWKDDALKICCFYAAQPDYLWTDTVMSVSKSAVVLKFGAGEMPHLQATQASMLEEHVDREQIAQMLEELNSRDQDILKRRFGIGCDAHTLQEVAEVYGLNKERIRQIEWQALGRLRDIFRQLEMRDKFLAGEWRAKHLIEEAKWKAEQEKRMAEYRIEKIERDKAKAAWKKAEYEKEVMWKEEREQMNADVRKVWQESQRARQEAIRILKDGLRRTATAADRRVRAMDRSLETGEGYLTCLLKGMREDELKEKRDAERAVQG